MRTKWMDSQTRTRDGPIDGDVIDPCALRSIGVASTLTHHLVDRDDRDDQVRLSAPVMTTQDEEDVHYQWIAFRQSWVKAERRRWRRCWRKTSS
ncbi:hypothetical protein RUM43_005396 [Polyplax serrata]|uniref:Uncharacterized protein n=1 Tax=Polyplax serrata TaxID=468196 RepID=A0AAN8S2V4_POLSC